MHRQIKQLTGATLADLYDPLTMPKDLLDAHRANDEAVDACYGKHRFKNEWKD
ncbi:MAG: type IIL restriction-modification enzyme MmeI [Pyrinomonadaceae bacterium]